MPFPGAYVINNSGTIVAKVFEHNFAARPGPEQLLAAALGNTVDFGAGPTPVDVAVEVSFDGSYLPVGVTRELVARFRVPDGQHLYDAPVPDGLVAASISVTSPGVLAYSPVAPVTRMLDIAGHTLHVYDGNLEIRLPVAQNGSAMFETENGHHVVVEGAAHWQACDDVQCFLPRSHGFRFEVEAGPRVGTDLGPQSDQVPAMNGAAHFARMRDRRS